MTTIPLLFAELDRALAVLDGVLDAPEPRVPPLDHYGDAGWFVELVAACGLDALDALLLAAAVAVELDARYVVRFAALDPTGRSGGFTADVARELCAGTTAQRAEVIARLRPDASLRRTGLLTIDERVVPPLIRVEADVLHLLLGQPPVVPSLCAEFPASELTTVHTLDDLVLAPAMRARVEHLVDRIRWRDTVVGTWGFGEHHDGASRITALFHGPPGTGKTMSAAVIAKQVGRAAFRVDLSTTVSKYIGETAKNLERVFARAEREGWVLFFDEADALFGSRTSVSDAHDRYANQEVAYLLQRLDAFDGVAILASNLLANVDDAFRRRIDVFVEFTMPARSERARLWANAFPDRVPIDPTLDLAPFADGYELSGAEIRAAALEAAYLAAARQRAVDANLLDQAVRAQLHKAGRAAARRGG